MTAPHDHGTPDALRARHGPRWRWWLLFTVMIGTMASIMSSTIVNVAIPDMSRQFTLGQERAQWVTSGFMVAMTVSMLATPWLLERYGYRRTYVGATLLLLAGGIWGGLSDVYAWVLAARVAEGLAAGVLQPIPAIIILRAFEPHEQGRASGVFGTGVVLAPAIGPSVGGVLVDAFGWRSIFFMVVPLCLLALWLARRYVPITGTAPAGSTAAGTRSAAGFDWRGLALVSAGVVALLNGLVLLHGGAGEAAGAALLLAMGALLLGGFVVWQCRLQLQHRTALMNLSLFEHRQFAMGGIVAFIYGTALFGSTYLLPVYMQLALGLSASYVGTLMLPAGLVLAITISIVGRLADRQPAHLLVTLGLALLSLSFLLMLAVGLQTALWVLVVFATVGRIGLGFVLPSLNLGAMRGLERGLIPQGSSVINFIRTLGGSVGVSMCGIVLEWRIAARGDSLTIEASSPARLAAFNDTFIMLAVLCALAGVAAWRLRAAPAR